jgi:hypothetical protein
LLKDCVLLAVALTVDKRSIREPPGAARPPAAGRASGRNRAAAGQAVRALLHPGPSGGRGTVRAPSPGFKEVQGKVQGRSMQQLLFVG